LSTHFPEIEARIAALEADAEQFATSVRTLKQDWATQQEALSLQGSYEEMRQAILRYGVACAQVDVQTAMMRARSESRDGLIESLRAAMDEEAAASLALREIARRLPGVRA
jgi:hypothetical protein